MNKKLSIVLSSIAAVTIFVSAFAFNSLAVGETKAVNEQNKTDVVNSVSDTQKPAQTLNATKPEVQQAVKDAADNVKKSGTNTATVKNTADCPTTNNQQTNTKNTTSANIKNQLQSALNNSKTNSEVANKLESVLKNCKDKPEVANQLKTIIENSKCNTSAAKNKDISSARKKLDELLKSLNKGTNNTNTPNKPSTPSTPNTPSNPAPEKPSTPAPSNGDYAAFQKKVVELVNQERAKNGLKALTMNTELSKVATLKSQDMANKNYFDHNSPTYGSPFDMMKKFGISYRTAGENIAMGQTSPEQVMQGWMNSPGHRANILNGSFTQIGVGIAKNSSGRLYWTQQFIG